MSFKTLLPIDITDDYVKGLQKEEHFLLNRADTISRSDQTKYLEQTISSNNATLFGLFARGELLGTVGAQEIRSTHGAAIGVFVFNKRFLHQGFGKVAVWAGCYLLHHTMQTNLFRAGIRDDNSRSLRVFSACGFEKYDETQHKTRVRVGIKELVKPDGITGERLNLDRRNLTS